MRPALGCLSRRGLAAGLVLTAVPAGAHPALVASPPRVALTFSEQLEGVYVRLSVEDARGARVDRGDAALAPDDGRQLRASLRPLAPGIYTVRFRVLSVDGHVVESSFVFTVRDRAPGEGPR